MTTPAALAILNKANVTGEPLAPQQIQRALGSAAGRIELGDAGTPLTGFEKIQLRQADFGPSCFAQKLQKGRVLGG